MRLMLNLIIAMLLFLVGYNYGMHTMGKKVVLYQELYNQAIQWQLTTIPHKEANPKLLWKTKG